MAAGLAPAASAELQQDSREELQAYVESNLLGIFYHELGHALVDVLDLPIFGQEEDAADVLSVFLIDALYDEDSAVALAYDTAFGFLDEADAAGEPAYWDVHGPDLQRYYNLVCIFYGANPEEREDVAEDLGLPENRAESCPFEYDQAADSWGGALDSIASSKGGSSFRLGALDRSTPGASLTSDVVSAEAGALNLDFKLPAKVTVTVKSCGEANAFYDPEAREIVMCAEFADELAEIYGG